jgi:hypothetical protein
MSCIFSSQVGGLFPCSEMGSVAGAGLGEVRRFVFFKTTIKIGARGDQLLALFSSSLLDSEPISGPSLIFKAFTRDQFKST